MPGHTCWPFNHPCAFVGRCACRLRPQCALSPPPPVVCSLPCLPRSPFFFGFLPGIGALIAPQLCRGQPPPRPFTSALFDLPQPPLSLVMYHLQLLLHFQRAVRMRAAPAAQERARAARGQAGAWGGAKGGGGWWVVGASGAARSASAAGWVAALNSAPSQPNTVELRRRGRPPQSLSAPCGTL